MRKIYPSDHFTARPSVLINHGQPTVKTRDRTFETDSNQVSTVLIKYLKLPCPLNELMEIRIRYPPLKDVKLVGVGEPTMLIPVGNQWLHLRLDERPPLLNRTLLSVVNGIWFYLRFGLDVVVGTL